MKKKVKVIKSHRSEVRIPFQAEKGEVVSGKEKPTEWEGWLYCKNKSGIYGWVPKAFVSPIADSLNKYQLNCDYNAYEITISKGELVKIKEKESGWALIESENGEIGWIPLENLDSPEK